MILRAEEDRRKAERAARERVHSDNVKLRKKREMLLDAYVTLLYCYRYEKSYVY